jgi:O-antigen ligase
MASPLHERLVALTRAGVVITATVMPLYLVRFKIGPLPTTLLEISILITLALYAASLLVGRGPLPGRTPYEIPIALFLIAGVIGIFVAPDHRAALGIYRAFLVEPVIVFYIALAVFPLAWRVESIFVCAAVATVLFCVADIVFFARAALAGTLIPGNVAAAFKLNPNYVALYLEPLIGFTAGFLFFGHGRARWIAFGVLAILGVTEVLTFSRGGLLALVALALLAFITIRNWWWRVGLIATGLAGGLIIYNLPLLGQRIRQSLKPGSGTLFTRERIWVQTVKMMHDHPIFGAGLGGYQTVMAPYRAADPNSVPEPYPHNIALTSYTELGLLGLFAFSWILIRLVVEPWIAFSRSAGLSKAILWGTGAAFAMIAVHGLVDSPYWKNDLSVEFWLLAAMQILALRAVRSSPGA